MATKAELPLSGGRPGATVVLHPLRCATVAMPDAWAHGGPGPAGAAKVLAGVLGRGRTHRAPIVAYLIEHPEAGPLLVDTGFAAAVETDKRRALGAVNAQLFRGIRMEETIAAQLERRGIAPADLVAIVMTHLHADHASGLADFAGATALVSEAEWRAAHARDAVRSGYHAAQLDERVEYRLLPYDADVDLFGDGSVTLLPTPGHTRGHFSLVVRLGGGEALLAGDAIYTLDNLRTSKRPFVITDGKGYRQSIDRLSAWDRDHPGALLIPGHDEDVWATLKPSYS